MFGQKRFITFFLCLSLSSTYSEASHLLKVLNSSLIVSPGVVQDVSHLIRIPESLFGFPSNSFYFFLVTQFYQITSPFLYNVHYLMLVTFLHFGIISSLRFILNY